MPRRGEPQTIEDMKRSRPARNNARQDGSDRTLTCQLKSLGEALPPPAFVPLGSTGTRLAFRHAEQDRTVLCVQFFVSGLETSLLSRGAFPAGKPFLCRI